jgi:hypothetical protein
MNSFTKEKDTHLLANVNATIDENSKKSVFYIHLSGPCLIEQIRIPRINNIVHSSLPKIENPSSESKPQVEVFILDR